MQDAERDLLVELGLHDAVDHLAVCAIASERDHRADAASECLFAHSEAIAPRFGELQLDGAELLADRGAELRPVLTDKAVAGHRVGDHDRFVGVEHRLALVPHFASLG